ncbi:MAG: OadG family protein [Gammaproteobacteria bacterium]|nr:OadG family protein [Gammaproteobacteria bacterium]
MSEIAFILLGFGIVMAVLALLWLVCVLIGFTQSTRTVPVASETAAQQAGPAPLPAAHLAAISAAIAAVLPGPHRIIRVYAPGHKAPGWVEEGRFELSNSHRIRWDWAITGPVDTSKRHKSRQPPPEKRQ